MKYPSTQAYNEALQMASVAILDATLRGGRVETDPLGLPFGRTGSFAITFKIAAGGSKFAFRCFLQNRATIHERYDAISSHLKGVQLPYFVDFTYLDEGIRVESVTYPTVRMSWAGGVPLGIYLQDHHADAGRMTALHQQIQGMALALGAAGLAHGDIQGGNLLIGDGGAIKLVDYDGMYVPSIAALGAIETGHPNFQHPERAAAKPFDERVDQFSFALLHTVIAALIERPNLWSQLNSDPDKILIGESDIADPFSSPAFAALTALPATGAFATSMQAIASAPYAQVPDFTDFLNHRNIPQARTSARTRANGSTTTSSGSTGSTPWYADHIPGAAPTSQGVPSGDALGSYVARDPVIDASRPTEWVGGRPSDVEVIGKIERADVGETGKDLPYVRLVVCDGDPELTIDVWADGLHRFAEQGITVNKTWTGQNISARGTIQGPIGSPTGERYSLTIDEPQNLERINAQQARWRLSTATSSSSPPASPAAATNTHALSSLSSSGIAGPRVSRTPTQATIPPRPPAASSHSWLNKSPGWFWIVVGAITAVLIALVVIVIIAMSGVYTAAIGENSTEAPDAPASTIAAGDCVARTQDGLFTKVSCNDTIALYTVVTTLADSEECPSSLSSWVTRNLNVCMERSSPDLLDMNTNDCLDINGFPIGCGNLLAKETVAKVVTSEVLCRSGRVVQVVNATSRFLCMEPIIDYETCVEGDNYDRQCFKKLKWEYESCWTMGEGARLEQFKKSSQQWEVVKADIARNDGCMPDYPWTVSFTRKSSTPGVKEYRLFFPSSGGFDTTIEDLTITVTEKPRS